MASACVTNIKIEPYTWHRTTVDPPAPDLSPDFEFFRLDDPTVTMLPADELFSDGKLKPISTVRSSTSSPSPHHPKPDTPTKTRLSQPDPFFSPRAPTCSIRWKNILKLKKLNKPANSQTGPPNPKHNTIGPSRSLLFRPSKHDSDTDSSVSTSSRLSLSSSSSSSSQDEKPTATRPRGNTLVESPRLNSNGKVVFERSTSSPGSFNNNRNSSNNNNKNGNNNGGMRIERSYSAHVVRVAPVLNVVPVKFGFFSSSSKRDNLGNVGRVRGKSSRSGNRTEQA